ncbi:DUF6507 family protein [Streptomyces sp. NPDC059897]|uniref:DUF6507 family protein n=1 Tax=Streptomyces sp. NPDC059897 TaxID=3346994 RepID=UPI0036663EDA
MSSVPGTFQVDVEELSGFAARLDECASEMRGAGQQMGRASVSGMGHAAVESACSGFQDSWQYGIKQLSQVTESIRDGLQATAQAYSGADQAVCQAMTPSASAAAPPAPQGAAGPSPFG